MFVPNQLMNTCLLAAVNQLYDAMRVKGWNACQAASSPILGHTISLQPNTQPNMPQAHICPHVGMGYGPYHVHISMHA